MIDDVTDKNSKLINEKRRSAVRKLILGSSILGVSQFAPKQWATPVINTVILPAHAQTSTTTTTSPTTTSVPDTTTTAEPMARCCPYYYDADLDWCYDRRNFSGPGAPGCFVDYAWGGEPGNCPVPGTKFGTTCDQ